MKHWLVITSLCITVLFLSILLDGCKKANDDKAPSVITFINPPGFPSVVYDFEQNPVTEPGFLLGRKLFYDGRLSRNGQFSCASCHQPVAAFTTFEHDRSHGYNDSHTLRNAPALFNLAWYPYFNWDGGEKDLARIFEKHIMHPGEMADHLLSISEEINGDPQYKEKFRAAFGDEKVNSARILNALKQFVISLVSLNSKYDKVMRGEQSFSAAEQQGYVIFKDKCASCHKEPLFTDFSFRNVGIEVDDQLNDYGRMRITGLSEDSLKFRVPSLRNAEFTSYYTHDGRLSLPRHMIQHYRFGINQSPTLDPLLVNGITLTNTEEDQLVAFMRTLSDSTFLNNPRFRE